MATHTFSSAEDVSAAVSALTAAQRASAICHPLEDGTFELIVPDDADTVVTTADLSALKTSALIEAAKNALDQLVEQTAKSKGYKGSEACASYAASTNPTWSAEAQAFIAWRDGIWEEAFAAMANPGSMSSFPTVEAFVASMPSITWPTGA